MRRRWVFVGLALMGAGLAGVTFEKSSHNACSSGLGPFGSLTGDVARNCGVHNLALLAAVVATLFGLVLTIAALVIRS
jgi:hypothetical protein